MVLLCGRRVIGTRKLYAKNSKQFEEKEWSRFHEYATPKTQHVHKLTNPNPPCKNGQFHIIPYHYQQTT